MATLKDKDVLQAQLSLGKAQKNLKQAQDKQQQAITQLKQARKSYSRANDNYLNSDEQMADIYKTALDRTSTVLKETKQDLKKCNQDLQQQKDVLNTAQSHYEQIQKKLSSAQSSLISLKKNLSVRLRKKMELNLVSVKETLLPPLKPSTKILGTCLMCMVMSGNGLALFGLIIMVIKPMNVIMARILLIVCCAAALGRAIFRGSCTLLSVTAAGRGIASAVSVFVCPRIIHFNLYSFPFTLLDFYASEH